jgi:dynein heavy chain
MAGVCRFFKERDIEPVLKIATIVKSEIEEFKPKVPLLVALRKPGMKGRHWQNITDAVGFRVFPDDGFTF